MAYIGKSIESGTFSVLDTSGNTYNGSNTAFNLGTQVGSVAQLLVSHDGVIQKPGTDYTLSSGGAAITFTTAPASGASIFIVEISGAVGGPLDSDLNGTELILDADGDTSITADTDDQIDIKVAGTDQLTIKDGALSPVTDNDIDLGTSSLEFKDGYFDGTVHTDAINLGGTAITSTAAELNILDGTRSQIVNVSYDISTADGNLAITGAGFAPTSVIVFQTISNTPKWSFGMGTKADSDFRNTVNNYLNNADNAAAESRIVSIYTTADPVRAQASIGSFDSDGITLAWTKTGSPTGTAVMNFIFFK